jgi:serine/threonine protein kinase
MQNTDHNIGIREKVHCFAQNWQKLAGKVVITLNPVHPVCRLQMLQEVRLMKLVQHPYVVRLYEVIDTQTKLYLVLEFADGGDMYDYIMRHEGGLQVPLHLKV